MTQYAYFNPFPGWKEMFPNAKLQNAHGFKQVELNAGKISEKEKMTLRASKAQIVLNCPICDGRLYYNQGYHKAGNGAVDSNKSPYFYHNNRENCHYIESLSHALTKRFIFHKLKEAGYIVREQEGHYIDGKKVRADVAAYIGKEADPCLRLVVEVQASDLKPSVVSRKVNAYYKEEVPTAWVIVLDDLFTGYTGIQQTEFDPVQGEYTYKTLEPGKENYFVVTGKKSRLFTMLMNEYGYIMAVNHAGQVFLIRRDPDNEPNRIMALKSGKEWTPQDELYKITRVADKDVARTLLITPLLKFPEFMESKNAKGVFVGDYGGKCDVQNEDLAALLEQGINFENGMLNGEDAGQALDPISLIQETWKAQQLAEEWFIQEEERLKAEEDKRRQKEAEKWLRAEEGRKRAEADQLRQAHERWLAEQEKRLQEERSKQLRREEQARAAAEERTENRLGGSTPIYFPEEVADKDRYASPKKIETIEKQLILNGVVAVDKMHVVSLTNYEAEVMLAYLSGDRFYNPPIELIQNEKTIWSAYESLSPEERKQLEKNVFPEKVAPPWFISNQIKLNQKEREQERKRIALVRKSAEKEARSRS
ncbi:competence protein CoiA family protein [Paenibacillus polymyxa]|uniref:competence protein CoiA family protein n=1 Tax=Paenibacillus polymyxa TaxID=1406 RepID=UPI0006937900|nr:competence protein CoiA family protein [Paenibacillus polymyxa]